MNFMKKLCKNILSKKYSVYFMERELLKKPQKKGKIRQIVFLNLFRSLEYLFVVFPFFE
ncbi:hypothetical protein HMPREF1348_01339 [Enterococcus faecium 505]|uniref:Uncharacterized protein n=1 Tax=Enterococcus faecium 505 TaxID=1134806 RepID=J6K9A4_ENTFC|nr:hypothetical protein HMPREF1348_01339 [Enterococcus faecium 505]